MASVVNMEYERRSKIDRGKDASHNLVTHEAEARRIL